MSEAGKRYEAGHQGGQARELRSTPRSATGPTQAQARNRARLDDYRQSLFTLEQVTPRSAARGLWPVASVSAVATIPRWFAGLGIEW